MRPSAKIPPVLMFLSIISMVVGLTLTGCDKPKPAAQTPAKTASVPDPQQTIVALGDSLTAGFGLDPQEAYPAILQRKLRALGYPYRVVNAGVSGETSSGCVSRLNWVLRLEPDIVILVIGANDGMRGIDTALTKKNIQTIIDRFGSQNITVLLAGMRMLPNLGAQYTQAFNALYPELAKSNQLTFMPFFLKDVAAQKNLNLMDGIHPNSQGYEIIVRNLWPYLKTALAHHQKNRTP